MAKTVDELLREIEMEKTAADEAKKEEEEKETSESTGGSDLSETISKILTTGKKSPAADKSKKEEEASESESSESEKTSCAKSASAIDEIEKLAEEVKSMQYNELIKEAQLLGAALVDGAMLRQQQWEEATNEKVASDLENDPIAYAAFIKGAEDAQADSQLEKLAEYMQQDPEAYVAFLKGAEDAAKEKEKKEKEKEESEESESESEEGSEKSASALIEEVLATDPEAAAAFEKGASDAMKEVALESEIQEKLASDPEAAAAFNEGMEDAMAEKIASDPDLLNEVLEKAAEDPLAVAGFYLGSPEVSINDKVSILDAAYKEASDRGDYEAIADLEKIANDIAIEKAASDVFVASDSIMDAVIKELVNS